MTTCILRQCLSCRKELTEKSSNASDAKVDVLTQRDQLIATVSTCPLHVNVLFLHTMYMYMYMYMYVHYV